MNLKIISDRELLDKTKMLVQNERELLTDILQHLSEIQRRRLYSDLKLPSLFAYCTQVLKYSESQAQRRIVAMRLINEIPEIEEKVSSGELSLSCIVQAKTFFNQEEKISPMTSHEKFKILEELKNKSSREGEKILLAKLSVPPKPVIEKLRQATAEITEVRFGADEKLLAKMNRIKGLIAHRKSGLNISELINELCEIALNELDPLRREPKNKQVKSIAKQNPGLPKNIPPTSKVGNMPSLAIVAQSATARSYIPVKTKREVWQIASGKCDICQSIHALEIDHENPLKNGGTSGPENLRLLCRNCNQRAAVKKLGRDLMDGYIN